MDPNDLKSYTPMLCAETMWVRGRALFNEAQYTKSEKCLSLAIAIFEKYDRNILHIDTIMMAELHRDMGETIAKAYPIGSLHIDNYDTALASYSKARRNYEVSLNVYIIQLLRYLDPPIEGKRHYHPDLPIDERIELIDRIEDCRHEIVAAIDDLSQRENFIKSMCR